MKLPPGRLAPTAALLVTVLVSAMDITIISTVMPTIVGELGGLALYSWAFAGYLLTSTTTVPIYGKLADTYGRKPLFLIAMALFLLGSLLCGLAPSMELFIAARAVQGLGAGGLVTLSMTLAGDLFPVEERAKIQGWISAVWGVAAVAGPLAGSVIVTQASWRWVFWINLPIGLLAAAILVATVREQADHRAHRVDYPGAALLTLAVAALLLGLVEGGQRGFGAPAVLVAFATAAVLLALLVWVERRAPEPVVPHNLLRQRVLGLASLAAATLGACVFSSSTYLPLLVQGAQGGAPTDVAWVTSAVSLAWTGGSVAVGRVLLKLGFRRAALLGMGILSVGGLLLTRLALDSPLPTIVGAGAVVGTGMGITSTTLIVMAQNAVGWEQRGAVTGLLQFSQSIGGTLWVSLQGAVLSASVASSLGGAGMTAGGAGRGGMSAVNAMLEPAARAALPPDQALGLAQVLVGGLQPVFVLYLLAALAGLVVVALLPPSPTATRRGHGAEREAPHPA